MTQNLYTPSLPMEDVQARKCLSKKENVPQDPLRKAWNPSSSPNGGSHTSTISDIKTCAEDRLAIDHAKLPTNATTPVIQGIPLVAVSDLPDRVRPILPFPLLNAVQSKCFSVAFHSNENLVVSAPTGSGKTVVMELAICHLKLSARSQQFKVVYQSPTKALCHERYLDWRTKFSSLDLQCAELTGDTEASQVRTVQSAQIIITTPEKWDSITRRWRDHTKLMQMVKLFLIDEVHILKESRGATLEAVVSRMKSGGSNIRFVALSATLPNSEDVAQWLGRDAMRPELLARWETFGEEFRPVQLQKVVYGFSGKANDFSFDNMLEAKLPETIAKHSKRKSTLVFCPFRKSCQKTAKGLAQLWSSAASEERLWNGPKQPVNVSDHELQHCISAGVAFHHAGLDLSDRQAVEQGFIACDISIICCTSTLAVGVNLPCYLVIVKGTIAWTENGPQEYADLEVMQMLGRAGRPQFEQSACAVILTRQEHVNHYQNLVSGQDALESCLHLNLIDHLNAEIGLGTVWDVASAKRWLASTFLFVRLCRSPDHYRLEEDVTSKSHDEALEQICVKDVTLLQEVGLVTREEHLKCTDFGDAMARYYVKFDTMKMLLSLPLKAKISEILSALAKSAEFKELRLKSGEKAIYKHINRDVSIKFPIKVDIALPAHKVSLLVQAELGGVEYPTGDTFSKHRNAFQQDKSVVFQHANRLARCVVDCQLSRNDSVSARHALELARGIAAHVWENSPLQLKQLDQIGNVAVRKLANVGITSIESLEHTEAHRLELVLGRGPPFGMKLLSQLAQFPRLWVDVRLVGQKLQMPDYVAVTFKSELGFLNETVPTLFRRKPVYICFLAETSDGKLIDFRRISAAKLHNGHEVLLTVELEKSSQYILCHVMCDEIAATCKTAELRPKLPVSLDSNRARRKQDHGETLQDGASSSRPCFGENVKRKHSETFDENALDDGDLLAAENLSHLNEDVFERQADVENSRTKQIITGSSSKRICSTEACSGQPAQLESGRWVCNHRCKDKNKCKHLCCREGLEKPPKPTKNGDNSNANTDANKKSFGNSCALPSKVHGASNGMATKSGSRLPFQLSSAIQTPKSLQKLHQATTSQQATTDSKGAAHENNEKQVLFSSNASSAGSDVGNMHFGDVVEGTKSNETNGVGESTESRADTKPTATGRQDLDKVDSDSDSIFALVDWPNERPNDETHEKDEGTVELSTKSRVEKGSDSSNLERNLVSSQTVRESSLPDADFLLHGKNTPGLGNDFFKQREEHSGFKSAGEGTSHLRILPSEPESLFSPSLSDLPPASSISPSQKTFFEHAAKREQTSSGMDGDVHFIEGRQDSVGLEGDEDANIRILSLHDVDDHQPRPTRIQDLSDIEKLDAERLFDGKQKMRNEHIIGQEKEEQQLESQRPPYIDDIDPEIYDQFKDIVEFV